MNRPIFLTGLLVIIISVVAEAQNKPWTFQQCLDTALRRNIALNQTRLANEVNKINLEQSRANRIPSLGASVNENANFGKNIDPNTNTYVSQIFNSTNLGINSSLNLFSGRQNYLTIMQNIAAVNAGKYDIDQAKNDVVLSITTAYLQVLFSYEILDAAQSQADATEAQVEMTRKLVNAGKVPELNLYQIQSQWATDKVAVVNAQSQLDLAKVTLMQLMEVPVADSFELVKPTLDVPDLAPQGSSDMLYQKALSIRPEIASASLRTSNAQLGIKINEGALWPRLNLGGNISTNYATSLLTTSEVSRDPFFYQMWNNIGAGLALNLSIPIYSNRQYKSSIERAKIGALDAQLAEQNTKNQLRKIIEQASTDVKNAIKKYEATQEQLNASELSYKSIEKKYSVGLMTPVDFLVEKNNYSQALSNMIQAKYDYIFKTRILDFYEGKQITF